MLPEADAQKCPGFNYAKHQRANKKIKKKANRRMRAAGGNFLNIKCTIWKTFRYRCRSRSERYFFSEGSM
jgi:hypothetical protein